MNSNLNALTIDVEEHFQVHAFETVSERSKWDRFPSRVVINTRRVLDLLDEYSVQATFFILGWVADRHPRIVREIVARGHEVATHGYWHELVYRQTPGEFADDLNRSLEAIRRAVGGVRVRGYRAPTFSITDQSLWALPILRDHGIKYDSSIFPVAVHDSYGIGGAHRFANKTYCGVWEFPVSTLRVANQNLPVAGGGYFRLFPLAVTRAAIRHLNAQSQPAVVYLHPWEFDPGQPRMSDAPILSRFRHYVNLVQTENRLRALMQEFRFAPMCEVFGDYLNGN